MGSHSVAPPTERERAELDTVLSSERFARSPRLAKLLVYLCNKYFEGEADQVKEYSIATEVLGRPPGFDPSQDAIARVEAHRLRRKLKEYYAAEGASHRVRIVLSPGTYVPVFCYSARAATTPAHATADPEADELPEVGSSPNDTLLLEVLDERPSDSAVPVAPPESPTKPATSKFKLQWWAYLAIAAVAGAVGALSWRVLAHQAVLLASTTQQRAHVLAASQAPGVEGQVSAVRLLAGCNQHGHTDAMGNAWQCDQYFSGGRSGTSPHEFLARTSDPMLFQNIRTGEFSYNIPLKPGVYELHLYFVETVYGPGMTTGGGENSRTFLVQLNGKTFLDNFDILSDAMGPNVADERVFRDIEPSSDGQLHLVFVSQRGQPIVSAIEILPGTPRKTLPIRLLTQQTSYTDHEGKLWSPDDYYSGGQQTIHKQTVTGTADPDLYATERYGNFSYAIPADTRDFYTVTLHFAETYWGGPLAPTSGVGSRVFNVDCNGVRLLENFDIFKEVGGAHAMTKTFRKLRPNAQGKLLLSFDPVANYASVFAIEVEDEGT